MIERSDAGRILSEMVRTARTLRSAGRRAHDERLVGTQYGILQLLRDGEARQSELAHRLEVSAPVASRAVDALESDGLAERRTDPDDARAVRVAITEAGRERLARRDERVVTRFADALADWSTEDAERAVRILERLNTHLCEVTGPEPSTAPERRHDESEHRG